MELFIGESEGALLARRGIRPEDAQAVFAAGWRTRGFVRDEAAGLCTAGGVVSNITLWVTFREETSRCVLTGAYYHRIQIGEM